MELAAARHAHAERRKARDIAAVDYFTAISAASTPPPPADSHFVTFAAP